MDANHGQTKSFGINVIVQNLLSFSLLTKNLKIKIYITISLPVVLYGCETWSLTLEEELRLRVFGESIGE